MKLQPRDYAAPEKEPTDLRAQRDFFIADRLGCALKADIASMEVPIFSLSTRRDLSIGHWESQDGTRRVTVTPSVLGRATQHDKDVLIYLTSQLVAGADRQQAGVDNRKIRFTAYDFLKTTGRGTSGAEYKALATSLDRLHGTSIKTNIATGGVRIEDTFNLIERWTTVSRCDRPETMSALEVVLSDWLVNAIRSFEVLTLHKAYFSLRKPLERRLYELARKHCGHQPTAQIGLDLLRRKAGSKATLKEFRRMLREIVLADSLPEYRLFLNMRDTVTIYTRDNRKLARAVLGKVTDLGSIVLSPTE
ncbi:replication initiator protein A [Paraburkholderia fungorum]|uniref:replication initiator protein A n=1 Tax=Paraburkholderia fungorum TaxID=134537 RepID=UPI0009434BDC|nr:replication initiator protein A [Paraburkholderia fungorum]